MCTQAQHTRTHTAEAEQGYLTTNTNSTQHHAAMHSARRATIDESTSRAQLTAHLTAQSIDHLDQRKRITSTRTIEPLRAPTAHSTSHALSTSTNERRANEESTPAPMEAHVTAHSTEHHEEHSGINGTRSIKQHRELKTVAGAPCRWRRRVRVAQHSHHTTLRHHLSQHRR